MSASLGSLRKYLPSLKRGQRGGSEEDHVPVQTETVHADGKKEKDKEKEKAVDDSDSDAASKEIATQADPDLSPGGLTLEEGACMRPFYVRASLTSVYAQIRLEAKAAISVSSAARSLCESSFLH